MEDEHGSIDTSPDTGPTAMLITDSYHLWSITHWDAVVQRQRRWDLERKKKVN